jgi:hypothetical protein
MNRTGTSWRIPGARKLLPATAVLAATGVTAIGLTVAGCGGAGSPAVSPAPAAAHTAAERAAVTNWLVQTNQMWAYDDFAAVDQVTTGQMRSIYLAEESQASLPKNADRVGFELTGLSITIPCHTGRPAAFVAYGDTNVFDLGGTIQSVAMVFERSGGRWKLATAVDHPDGAGWPALCTQGTPPPDPAVLAAGSYAPDLARVLTSAMTGAAQTTRTAAPFAVNDFLAGSGSITVQSATSIRQDRRDGVSLTGRFTPAPDPTVALPLAGGRGYWLIGILTQSDNYSASSGVRAKDWPDGNQVATPRPAVVHQESDTFITTYTAIDPPRAAGATVALDGFFGWPLSALAS